MQKELMEAAQQDYIYQPSAGGLGGMVAVMERTLAGEDGKLRYEYKFLASSREETTQKELNEALAEGYQFLDLSTVGEQVIVLGRLVEAGKHAENEKIQQ